MIFFSSFVIEAGRKKGKHQSLIKEEKKEKMFDFF